MTLEARQAAEAAVRASYGRLIAFLAARSRDVAAAEDALAEALRSALSAWAERGVPANPEAWLLTAARRNLGHVARHGSVRAEAAVTLRILADEAQERAMSEAVFPDERLKLLFICAHPAIDAAARAPLMLQTVLGLDAARIASAFLVAPATMGQRLVRAKAKIRDAGIAFAVPQAEDLAPRLDAVLNAIYAAYGSGWEDVTGSDSRRRGMVLEAVWLARLVIGLLPAEPEARGLLALMLHCEARRPARRDSDGGFVPLLDQDVRLWSRDMTEEAEQQLAEAARAGRLGRFQLEAAIQSVHAQRAVTGKTDWHAVATLYAGLIRLTPAIGASVGHAAAVAEAYGPSRGLALLQEIPSGAVGTYQPYWALGAHLYRRLDQGDTAAEWYGRAIGLTEEPAIRSWLMGRRESVASRCPNVSWPAP